jgi:hypothetical protein
MENSHQYHDEQFLDGQFDFGDKVKLAKRLNVSLSEVSQQLNPNEPRKSDFHKCARFLRAVRDEFGPEKISGMLAHLCAIGDAPACGNSDLTQLTADLHVENSEFVGAHLRKAPLHVQHKELIDVKVKTDRALAALKGQVNRKEDCVSVGARAPDARRRKVS